MHLFYRTLAFANLLGIQPMPVYYNGFTWWSIVEGQIMPENYSDAPNLKEINWHWFRSPMSVGCIKIFNTTPGSTPW